jgi:hypothetical protein
MPGLRSEVAFKYALRSFHRRAPELIGVKPPKFSALRLGGYGENKYT